MLDFENVKDLASGKWHRSRWGEDVQMTKIEKQILKTARKLEKLVDEYLKECSY